VGLTGASQPWLEWKWIHHHFRDIWNATNQHIQLTLIAVGIGLAISLPLGLLAWRWKAWQRPVYGVSGALFTIPSLALFALLIPVTGFSRTTAEIGLVSYTLLILIRNIVAGLDGVPADVRDAAEGLGYGPVRLLFRVDLPLAAPTVIAGVRLAMVTTIGLVAVASFAGAGGGLGTLIQDGYNNNFRTEVVLGCLLSVLLAAVLDAALLLAQRAITPWVNKGARA
jgi:osmoprotectant transport system permease protein